MKLILFNAHDIVVFVTIYVCLIFAVITISTRRDMGWSQLWLCLFLVSQACLATAVLALWGEAFHTWLAPRFPAIFALLELAFWAEGPLLVLYTRTTLYRSVIYSRRDLVLLFPFFAYSCVMIYVSVNVTPVSGSSFLGFVHSDTLQYYEIPRNIVRASFGLWAFFIIKQYQSLVSDAYSNLDQIGYKWLKILVAGFIIMRLWTAFYLLLWSFLDSQLGKVGLQSIDFDLLGISMNYGQLLLVSVLLFFGLSDSRYMRRVQQQTFDHIKSAKTEHKHHYTEEQIQRLHNHMEATRPYLDAQLKIDDLAHQVSVSPKVLSNLINREFGSNFFEYINSFRLKEIKRYLRDPELQEQAVIDLAFRAGYNSKTSFNRLFKQDTSLTPSQYRQNNINKQSAKPAN